jgi:hypothetical protein
MGSKQRREASRAAATHFSTAGEHTNGIVDWIDAGDIFVVDRNLRRRCWIETESDAIVGRGPALAQAPHETGVRAQGDCR